MRSFRRLPPLLRVASIVGLLCFLAAIGLLIHFLTTGLDADRGAGRVVAIAGNLLLLGLACSFVAISYTTRFRGPDRAPPFPLDSWQNQARAIALLALLPLCGIALALSLPPASMASSMLAAVVWGAVPLAIFAMVLSLTDLAGDGPAHPHPPGDSHPSPPCVPPA